jgi:hypothetical protein
VGKLIQIVFLFIIIYDVHGQLSAVKISGSVRDIEKRKLENIPVVLMVNRDTLAIQNSDSKGEFLFDVMFSTEHDYYIFLNLEHQNSKQNWIKLHAKGDTNIFMEYKIDLNKLRVIRHRFDNSIYYEKNDTEKYQNFDLDYFKKVIQEYPQMCIRFVQTINPKEKKIIAKRRKKHFLELLRSAGINMNQIIFSNETFTLDLSNSNDVRSRIEGVVYSMDGNCK